VSACRVAFKSSRIVLKRGDVVRGATGGGGGYGDPAGRDPAAIAEDVASGHPTIVAAKRLYGYGGSGA
jgi:N-methylhydantoinase B